MIFWAAVAGLGWGMALLFVGLFMGERGRRKYVENLQFYGGPGRLERARAYHPDDPEDRVEKAVDGVLNQKRIVRPKDAPPSYDPQTIENGVQFLLSEARARGEPLTQSEALDEVIRMLNAEGTEMA